MTVHQGQRVQLKYGDAGCASGKRILHDVQHLIRSIDSRRPQDANFRKNIGKVVLAGWNRRAEVYLPERSGYLRRIRVERKDAVVHGGDIHDIVGVSVNGDARHIEGLSVNLSVNSVGAEFAEVGPILARQENGLLQIGAGLLLVVIDIQNAHLSEEAGGDTQGEQVQPG